jgi:glycosyltransferase involved in cell wall biosynthesis
MKTIEISENPKVCIITATYNGERYIERTIDSVLRQTLTDFEYIVVDDGSTDATPMLLETAAARDPRIRVVSQPKPSGGPTVPKNVGLAIARAPYVCFLDHDDYLHPEKLMLMCEGLDRHPDWVAAFHDLQLVTAEEVPHKGTYLSNSNFRVAAADLMTPAGDGWFDCDADFYTFMSLQYAAMHTASVILAPRRLMKDPVSFRERFKGCDDTDLWLRVGFQGKIGYLDKILSYYRIHDTNLSGDTISMTKMALEVMEENYLRGRARWSQSEQDQYKQKIHTYRLDLAYALRKQRRYREAGDLYFSVMRYGKIGDALNGLLRMAAAKFAGV